MNSNNYFSILTPDLVESCPICFENIDETTGKVTTVCGHNFCTICFVKTVTVLPSCPICRREIVKPKQTVVDSGEDLMTIETFIELLHSSIMEYRIRRSHKLNQNAFDMIHMMLGPFPATKETSFEIDRYIAIFKSSSLITDEVKEAMQIASRQTSDWYEEMISPCD